MSCSRAKVLAEKRKQRSWHWLTAPRPWNSWYLRTPPPHRIFPAQEALGEG